MNDIVANLEERLLPEFRELANSINTRFLRVKPHASSISGGQLTGNLCHSINLTCFFPDSTADQADYVVLNVCIDHVNSDPTLSAEVSWGEPSYHVETEFSPDPLAVSDAVLRNFIADLPRLYDSLKAAVARREPSVPIERHA